MNSLFYFIYFVIGFLEDLLICFWFDIIYFINILFDCCSFLGMDKEMEEYGKRWCIHMKNILINVQNHYVVTYDIVLKYTYLLEPS